jgi:hypothetical protein
MLGWAESQLERLKTNINRFLATEPYHLVAKHDDVTGDETLRVCPIREVPEDLVFEIGDVVHNLRVPLDYAIFAIASRRNPDWVRDHPKQVAFPISHDFVKQWPTHEGHIRKWGNDEIVRVIEGFQPHNGRNSPQSEALRVLDELENPHKHRQLLAAGSATVRPAFSIMSGSGSIYIVSMRGGTFGKDGREVMRYRFLAPPDPKAKMQFDGTFGVAFSQEGPAKGAEVTQTLENIRDRIRDDIVP